MSNIEAGGRRLLPTKQLKARFGVVGRTVDRWQADPELGFPKPLIINGRRYWYEDIIEAWERSRIAGKAA